MGRISTKLLSLFIVLGLFLPVVSRAQSSGLSLLTSPLPILMKTTPGVPVTTDIKLRNTGTGEETLKVTLMKFEAYEESGKPALMEAEPTDEFLKWVKFSEDTFTVAPGEWKTIQATITPPKEASFGYYYAFVFSRANENLSPEERRTALNGGTAILALLDVDVPGAKKEITLEKFSLDKSVYEFLPTTFSITLKNQGNVHVEPHGLVELTDMFNRLISRGQLNENSNLIMPSTAKVLGVSMQSLRTSSPITLYSLKAAGADELGQNPFASTKRFLYISPWVVGVLGIIGVLFLARHKYPKMKLFKKRRHLKIVDPDSRTSINDVLEILQPKQ